MDMNIKESCEKALDEIDILEFELEDTDNFQHRLNGASQIVKKLFLLDMLKLMQPVENQLRETDLKEFRNTYKEWVSITDAIVDAIRNNSRLDCNETILLIIEKMLPYFRERVRNITVYKKSKQIHLAV